MSSRQPAALVLEREPAAQSRKRGGLRGDIQALRALAVGLVVTFHVLPALVPGGYIGVDIFFVISGFLITGHLLREVTNTGRIQIARFWARRVRRLLPASLIVLFVCAILTVTVLPGIVRTQNLQEIAYAAFYGLNWLLASNAVDYLGNADPASLAQHFWSLSVEEQFYFIWPVLIMAATLAAVFRTQRGGGNHHLRVRRWVFVLLCIVLIASFLFSVVETARSQPSAYFVTTTRAWEFATGGLIAFLPKPKIASWARGALSWLAVVGILVCALAFGPDTAFPGAIAAIPVLATALLIFVGENAGKFSPQWYGRGVPIQVIGDLSYPIYLWHWPLIIVASFHLESVQSWIRIALILIATYGLAYATERYIERPVRQAKGRITKSSVTFLAMTLAIASILAMTILPARSITAQAEERSRALQSQLSDASTDIARCIGAQAVINNCPDPYAYTATVDPQFAQEDSPWRWFEQPEALSSCVSVTVGAWEERSCNIQGSGAQILLIGDSHADHLMGPMANIVAAKGWGLRLESRQACSPFREPSDLDDANAELCARWAEELIQQTVAATDVDVVLISTRADSGQWTDNAKSVFSKITDSGKQVLLVNDIPSVDGRRAADGNLITGPACVLDAGEKEDACAWKDSRTDQWLVDAATESRIPVLDLRSVVCPDQLCHAVVGGVIVYSDENHFSASYALSLTQWLVDELEKHITQ